MSNFFFTGVTGVGKSTLAERLTQAEDDAIVVECSGLLTSRFRKDVASGQMAALVRNQKCISNALKKFRLENSKVQRIVVGHLALPSNANIYEIPSSKIVHPTSECLVNITASPVEVLRRRGRPNAGRPILTPSLLRRLADAEAKAFKAHKGKRLLYVTRAASFSRA